MSRSKPTGKDVADTLFFGFGLIFDLIVIIGALISEAFGKKD